MSRFDYVAYDQVATNRQQAFKISMQRLEENINTHVNCPRSKALALTKLEEVYMWIGKGIRDDQIERNNQNDSDDECNHEFLLCSECIKKRQEESANE